MGSPWHMHQPNYLLCSLLRPCRAPRRLETQAVLRAAQGAPFARPIAPGSASCCVVHPSHCLDLLLAHPLLQQAASQQRLWKPPPQESYCRVSVQCPRLLRWFILSAHLEGTSGHCAVDCIICWGGVAHSAVPAAFSAIAPC